MKLKLAKSRCLFSFLGLCLVDIMFGAEKVGTIFKENTIFHLGRRSLVPPSSADLLVCQGSGWGNPQFLWWSFDNMNLSLTANTSNVRECIFLEKQRNFSPSPAFGLYWVPQEPRGAIFLMHLALMWFHCQLSIYLLRVL